MSYRSDARSVALVPSGIGATYAGGLAGFTLDEALTLLSNADADFTPACHDSVTSERSLLLSRSSEGQQAMQVRAGGRGGS
jgi:hypothetical protein